MSEPTVREVLENISTASVVRQQRVTLRQYSYAERDNELDRLVDQAEEAINQIIREARVDELERLLCPIDCLYGDNSQIEHTRIGKSYITDRIQELAQSKGEK
jgi:hypothetical protein